MLPAGGVLAVAGERASMSRAPGERLGSVSGIERATDLCIGAGIVAIAALSHPYGGIIGDARVYIGRVMADLDPDGVGRDIMFRYDGQSGFTLFRPAADWLIAHLGVASGTWLLSVAALIVYGAAIYCCARSLAGGRTLAIVLSAALLLPRGYTSFEIMAAGEALAIPRPWAEALVLFAIACLASGRTVSAFALVCIAATIHPIMALPGLGLLVLVAGSRHPRWLIVAALGALATIAAGLSGVPLVSRAFTRIDPVWLDILRQRDSYLFVSMWQLHAWCKILVMAVTVLVGARHVPPVWSRIFYATLAVALSGCIASFVGADLLSSLLFTQVQLWRSLWLLAAMAPVATGICFVALPHAGWNGRAVLAALVAAWASTLLEPANAMMALLALGLAFAPAHAIRDGIYKSVFAGSILVALLALAFGARTIRTFLQVLPPEMPIETSVVWQLGLAGFFAVGLIVWLATAPMTAKTRLAAAMAALVGSFALVATRYDERLPIKQDIDTAALKPDLVAALATRPGEILWLGDDALWYWTRRANWSEKLQGAGLVFSRDLALIWHDRTKALVEAGLGGEELLDPWKAGVAHPERGYDAKAVAALCARRDAPAWIVMPLLDGRAAPSDPRLSVWTTPLVSRETVPQGDGLVLRTSSRRLLIPCASLDGAGALAKSAAR